MAGDDLVFQAAQPTTAANDFPAGTAFNSLDIASGDFTLAGNALQLGSSFTVGQNASGVYALPIAVSGQITVEVDSATPLVLSGVVSGQGSLVKTGSGSLTLSGPNVYGGPTTITTGTLQVGAATTNGPVVGDIVGSAAVAFNNQTNGGGRFANDRTMTTLAPQSDFNYDAFTINYGYEVASSFTVSSDSSTVTEFTFVVWCFPGDVPTSVGWTIGTTYDRSDSTPLATGVASGSNLSSTFVETNSYGYDIDRVTISGLNVAVASGNTYYLTLHDAACSAGDPIYWDESYSWESTSNSYSNVFGWLGDYSDSPGSVTFAIGPQCSPLYLSGDPFGDGVVTCVWNGSDGNNDWSDTANWDNGIVPAGGENLYFGGTAPADPIAVPDGMEFVSIEFAANGFSIGYDNSSSFTVDNGITVDAGITDTVIKSNIAIGCSGSLPINVVGANSDLTISGAISGDGYLDKEGAGRVILSGANDYTGGTMVRGGTLQFGDGTANGYVPVAGDILDDTALVFDYASPANQTFGGVISGWGSVTMQGTGTLTLAGQNTYDGGTSIEQGTLQLAGSREGQLLVYNSGFETPELGQGNYQYCPNGADWTFTGGAGISANGGCAWVPNTPYGSQVAFIQNVVGQESGGFSQRIPFQGGTYTIAFMAAPRTNWGNGANPFQVQVDGSDEGTFMSTTPTTGAFQPYATSPFPVSAGIHTISFVGLGSEGDQTSFVDQISITGPVVAGALPNGGPLSVAAMATLDLNGANATVGPLSGDGSIFLGSGSLTVNNDTGADSTFSGAISGDGRLTKTGSGTLTLSGENTFTGETRIHDGDLLLSTSLALEDSTLDMNIADGGNLDFGALSSATLGGLAGSRPLTLENSNTPPEPVALSVGQNSTDTTYSGTLTGGGSLTKIGPGMLTLAGDLTYTGPTYVNDGTLNLVAQLQNSTLATGTAIGPGSLLYNDPDMYSYVRGCYTSGNKYAIDRNDMMNILAYPGYLADHADPPRTVSAGDYNDLVTIVGAPDRLRMTGYTGTTDLGYVDVLAKRAVYGLDSLPCISAGMTSADLNTLVNGYFVGTGATYLPDPNTYSDPQTSGGCLYQTVAGPLFGPGGPSAADMQQGCGIDCFFLSTLGSIAATNPDAIRDMFHDNGDGTWTVRFYNTDGSANYVVVDRELPTDADGNLVFANYGQHYTNLGDYPNPGDPPKPLWIALTEKAYVEFCATGGGPQQMGTSYSYSNFDWADYFNNQTCEPIAYSVLGQPSATRPSGVFGDADWEHGKQSVSELDLIAMLPTTTDGVPTAGPANRGYAVQIACVDWWHFDPLPTPPDWEIDFYPYPHRYVVESYDTQNQTFTVLLSPGWVMERTVFHA